VTRILSVILVSVLALLPAAPLVCDAVCRTPDAPVSTGCHDVTPVGDFTMSDAGCGAGDVKATATVPSAEFRLQQRSLVAILLWPTAPGSAAASWLFASPRHPAADGCRITHGILRL
jgi:hypothetical protein